MPALTPSAGTSIERSVSAEPPNCARSILMVRCSAAPWRAAIRFAAASSAPWRWP
jgi:hypothetical protein